MSLDFFVLDTNIVTYLLKQDKPVVDKYNELVDRADADFIACPFVWFESKRGLLDRQSVSGLARLQVLFDRFIWQEYAREDWELASELWVAQRARGAMHEDADLLIAAFCINRRATLVTNNERHFDGLDVRLLNWKTSP